MRPHARAVVCACVLPAALLVVDNAGYSPFGPSKWAAVSVVGLVAAVAAGWGGGFRGARRALVLWLLFLGWLIVAAAVGLDPVYAWIGSPQRHFGMLTWLLCALLFAAGQCLDDEGDGRVVVAAGVAAGGLAGVWAVAELLGWQPSGVAGGSRLIGSMGSAALLGAAMTLVIPMAVGVAVDASWARRYRLLSGAGAALAGVALVGSGARAAWGGAALSLVVVVVVHRDRVVARPRRSLAAGGLLIVVVLAVGAVTGVAGRVPALLGTGGGGGSSRLDEWAVASKVLIRHPLTGVGPEGYRIAFPQGVDAAYVAKYGISPLPDRAHDSLLDVAVTTGLPGVGAYVGLLGVVGVFAVRALRRGPPWLAGAAVGVIAYSVAALALFPLAELEPVVWLLAGIVVAHTARTEELVAIAVPRPLGVAVAAVAVVAAMAGARDIAADRATRSALAALARGDGPAAQREARRAVSLRPDQIEYRLAAERADAAPDTPGAIDVALGDLSRGLQVSPADPILNDERGRLLLERAVRSAAPGDLVAARADLEGLVAIDPLNADDQLRLGMAAAQSGDGRAAEKAWLAADRLTPRSAAAATNLATLYARQGRWHDAAVAAGRALARDPSDAPARAVLAESVTKLGT